MSAYANAFKQMPARLQPADGQPISSLIFSALDWNALGGCAVVLVIVAWVGCVVNVGDVVIPHMFL